MFYRHANGYLQNEDSHLSLILILSLANRTEEFHLLLNGCLNCFATDSQKFSGVKALAG